MDFLPKLILVQPVSLLLLMPAIDTNSLSIEEWMLNRHAKKNRGAMAIDAQISH